MKTYRIILIGIAVILLIWRVFGVDFNDLSWSNNKNVYGFILTMVVIIIAMIYSIWHDAKKEQK